MTTRTGSATTTARITIRLTERSSAENAAKSSAVMYSTAGPAKTMPLSNSTGSAAAALL